MRSKIRLLLVVILVLIFWNYIFKFNFIGDTERHREKLIYKVNHAGFWDLTGNPIFIDDNDPNYNWAITAATNDWCYGSGVWDDPYVIENVTIDGQNSGSCIRIRRSSVYFIIRNCTIYNSGGSGHDAGIELDYTDNGIIVNNSFSNNNGYGILLDDSENNSIIKNQVNENSKSGIYLLCSYENTDGNFIYRNNITNNGEEGIYLDGLFNEHILDVNNNNISSNSICFNGKNGIYTVYCDYNIFFNNSIMNNTENGLYIRYGNYQKISENIIINNYEGIRILSVDYSNITKNIAKKNEYGLHLYSHHNTIIKNNIFTSNNLYGICCEDSDVINNIIYKNNFSGNALNAYDYSSMNNWDNGSVGNFWANYGGVDSDDDGIGDTSYDVPPAGGSIDNYPIWEDGDDAAPPVIEIILPISNQVNGIVAPNYHIEIKTLYTNTTWYTIDGGKTNYTFSGLTGTVNQTAWDNKGTEIMTLRFYANDSLDNVGFKDVAIWKDLIAPNIIIISPTPNQSFGITAPTFSLTIDEPNLQQTWYTLEGVTGTFSFTGKNGSINQDAWADAPEGEVTITFYAIDRAGNIDTVSVNVIKLIPSRSSIPGFNVFLLIGAISVISAIIIRNLKKLDN